MQMIHDVEFHFVGGPLDGQVREAKLASDEPSPMTFTAQTGGDQGQQVTTIYHAVRAEEWVQAPKTCVYFHDLS